MASEIEHPDEFGRPLVRSGVSDRIWRLKESDTKAFMSEVKRYFALIYPGYTVVRAKYPIIFLRDDRMRSAVDAGKGK